MDTAGPGLVKAFYTLKASLKDEDKTFSILMNAVSAMAKSDSADAFDANFKEEFDEEESEESVKQATEAGIIPAAKEFKAAAEATERKGSSEETDMGKKNLENWVEVFLKTTNVEDVAEAMLLWASLAAMEDVSGIE